MRNPVPPEQPHDQKHPHTRPQQRLSISSVSFPCSFGELQHNSSTPLPSPLCLILQLAKLVRIKAANGELHGSPRPQKRWRQDKIAAKVDFLDVFREAELRGEIIPTREEIRLGVLSGCWTTCYVRHRYCSISAEETALLWHRIQNVYKQPSSSYLYFWQGEPPRAVHKSECLAKSLSWLALMSR